MRCGFRGAAAVVGLILGLLPGPDRLWADAAPARVAATASSSPEPARLDAAAFGRLPAWFNGRATTLDAIARNTLQSVSGQAAWKWADGSDLSSADWILQIATGNDHWRDAEILVVEHPAVAELLGLPVSAEGAPATCCAIRVATEHLGELRQRLDSIASQTGPLNESDSACRRFIRRLQSIGDLLAIFRLSTTTDSLELVEEAEQALQMRRQPIPLLLPPIKTGDAWETLQLGTILQRLGPEAGLVQNPATEHWLAVLDAAGAGEADRFQTAIRDYETYLNRTDARLCPYQFTVPAGWSESGAPQTREAAFFSDTLAFGSNVTLLERIEGERTVAMRVSYFPGGAASVERIVNEWRISEGLAPDLLEPGDTTAIEVCGATGWCVDLTAPISLVHRDERLIGTSFSRENQTWVVTMSGPAALVTKWKPDLEAFLASLRLGAAEEVAHWFRYDSHRHPGPDQHFTLLAAVVPTDKAVWVLQSPLIADHLPAQREPELREWMQSLQTRPTSTASDTSSLPGAAPAPPFTWTVPPGWKRIEPAVGDVVLETTLEPLPLWWSLQPLRVERTFDVVRLVNHWREGTRLPRFTAEEVAQAITPIETPVGPGWLVRYDIPQSLP